MKKVLCGVVLLIALTLTSCKENSPEGVISILMDAVAEGDTKKAQSVMTGDAYYLVADSIARRDYKGILERLAVMKIETESMANGVVNVKLTFNVCTIREQEKDYSGFGGYHTKYKVCAWPKN